MSINGIWAAVPTFFHENGMINIHEWLEYIKYYASEWEGIVIGGTTGEGFYLSSQELATMIHEVRLLFPFKNIFGGITVLTMEDAMHRATRICEAGATGVLMTLPPYVRLDPMSAIHFFKQVFIQTQTLNLSWIVYNNPVRIGTDFTVEMFQKLIQWVPEVNIIGYKDSSGEPYRAVKFNMMFQDLKDRDCSYFCGNDDEWPESLMYGARKIISVAAGAWPDLFKKVKKSEENEKNFMSLMGKMKHLPNPLAVKSILSGLGWNSLLTRVPFDLQALKLEISHLEELSPLQDPGRIRT
jgi:dihydrodipicolinate synthase/N-acetylneuraminate lyase